MKAMAGRYMCLLPLAPSVSKPLPFPMLQAVLPIVKAYPQINTTQQMLDSLQVGLIRNPSYCAGGAADCEGVPPD